ncbi:MAG: response regulator, partial [Alphaproteobacteria bacterium]
MRIYSLDNLRFLVIDPSRHMQHLIMTVLRAFGAREFETASDGLIARSKLEVHRPDIIITELALPRMDGLELTRMVRSATCSSNPFVPIIMCTSHTEISNVVAARESGVTEFLAKPISAGSLYKRIYITIDNPREFLRIPGYVGPDRRRHSDPNYAGPKRRKAD